MKSGLYTLFALTLSILIPFGVLKLGGAYSLAILLAFNIAIFFVIEKKPNLKIWNIINNPFEKDNKAAEGCLPRFGFSLFMCIIFLFFNLFGTVS